VALAALLSGRLDARGRVVRIVISGGNVDPAKPFRLRKRAMQRFRTGGRCRSSALSTLKFTTISTRRGIPSGARPLWLCGYPRCVNRHSPEDTGSARRCASYYANALPAIWWRTYRLGGHASSDACLEQQVFRWGRAD
jgi:hypothetical protein